MSVENTKKEQLKAVLSTLAMDIALNEQERFEPNKGPEEIVRLLQYAATSTSSEVQQTFAKVGTVLTPGHKRFFEGKGISFVEDATIMVDDSPIIVGDDMPVPGKRKIIYRGQVKWV